MKNLAITLVAFISCVSSAARGKSNCVWYGECGNARGFKQPCPANHTALQLDHEEAEKILLKRCPHLFNGSEPPKTCCDPNQIMTMDKSLQMAEAIFGRCESCAKNLFRSICDFTCASDQARFMKATNWATEPSTGKEYITSVQIYISQEYTHATRESCSRVINPMTGTSALDIACGGNTGNKCTAERWFNFMGNSTINVMAPFDLVYCYHGEDALAPGPPLNPPTKLCSEAYDNSSSACSCVDCPGSCSSNDQWEISTPSFEFWGISGYGLIVGAVVVFISSCWSIVLIYLRKRTARIDRPIVTIRPVDQRPTRNLNTVTERIFVAWGRAFAQSPAVVLLSTAFIVIALSIGIKFLIVTVNPIEIWASPTSQSRIDKDYFDKHFQPFYRTEQIYLKSVGLEKITHETSIGTLVFGPVFQKEFLLAVYHLQDKIMQLGQDTDEGLEKICYAPVQNEFTGPVTLPLCTVQSVWGYFQNDLDLFNSTTNDNGYEENYLDQLYLCIQNSYNPECLSTYNGPVIPDITFGGYLQPDQITVEVSDYINATGLVLSFMYMDDLLSMGPPVYFVVTSGLNYSLTSVQNAICGGPQCNSNSLYSQLFSAANQSLQSYLAKPGSSWLDDYFDWTSVQSCCKYFPNNGSFCPHDSAGCLSCQIDKANMSSRPTTESFRKYISYFVSDIPDAYCAKGGRAAYYDALTYFYDEYGRIDVGDTYFMSYHSPLKKSSDWYKALEAARFVAKNITNTINEANLSDEKIRVFPYSVFYVFYEQYLTIWYETLESLGLSLFVIFVVTYLLTGRSLFSAFIVLLTVTMIIINLAGFMHWCNVSLNAVSLVNLVMGVGISVEFCSHVVHHYLYSDAETRVGKIAATLNTIGSSVFAGITLTKLVGIIVLAFAKTQIFQVFYFRMYLGILLMGATHGLIFLPALLSFIGPLDNANRGLENGYSSTFCK